MNGTDIHPTAIVSPEAQVGRDVSIGPYSVIGGRVSIGDGCRLGSHVVIHPFTTLGPGCKVHPQAVLGGDPQDLSFKGDESYVVVGSNTIIREGVTIHRGTKAGTTTQVGDNCYLMVNTHLGHNCVLGNRVITVPGALLGGYVEVGDGAMISGNVTIHQFVRIGRLAMLGGLAGLSQDVPPFCTAASARRNTIAGLNVVGLRRAGLDAETRKQIKRAFALVYQSHISPKEAVVRIRAEFTSGPALEMAEFIEKTKRGICGREESGEQAE